MASRSSSSRKTAQLTRDQIQKGIRRIEKRLEEMRQLDPDALDVDDPYRTIRPITLSIETALVETFGADSLELRRYQPATYFSIPMYGNHYDRVAYVKKTKSTSIQLLEGALSFLQEKLAEAEDEVESPTTTSPIEQLTASRKVFIVHGHDDGMKDSAARFLSSIGFDPIILHERANMGRTIIQKFREEAKDVGFAVVLLSPDDETTEGQRRARQNVILELGFFLGALGPERVAALKKGDVETPSDFDGVIYTAFDGGGSWKVALSKELQAAGYLIDWNVVMA